MQLFYSKDISKEQLSFVFDKEESKHIIKVLRKQIGDILYVTNGLGYLFKTEITLASDAKCTVRILEKELKNPCNYNLHMAVAPTKMNERFELFLEKATEIGIHQITPIICDNSERKVIKTERFEKIILSAMKQSNQCYLPILNDPITFKNFIKSNTCSINYIAHCEETNKRTFKDVFVKEKAICILIGPEGDFSEKEINSALEKKYIAVSLGNTRLRTETAALVACHTAKLLNQ